MGLASNLIMQLPEPTDSINMGAGSISNSDLSLLWPSNSHDDVIRLSLASILLEDPGCRLRVAHLEPLLQLHVGMQFACSSGRLQALLTEPSTARIFPVDFSNLRASDWRSRVVYIDLTQLQKEVAAAKQHSNSAAVGQYLQASGDCASGGSNADPAGQDAGLQSMLLAGSTSADVTGHLGFSQAAGQQPVTLESIFGGCGSQFSFPAEHGDSTLADVVPQRPANSASGTAGAGLSSSYGTAASTGAADGRVSLFGSSFEVPHAIASCWAGPSSYGSGMGSVGTAARAGNADNKVQCSLEQHDNCGGSSTASGSSTRSVSAAARAAAAAASRLRNASNNIAEGLECTVGSSVIELTAVGSPGALSALDVVTPKSCVVGIADASTSPVNSNVGEEDSEYNEAQLVFGQPASAAAPSSSADNVSAAAAAGSTEAAGGENPALGDQRTSPTGCADAHAPATPGTPLHGIDWARVTAMQQQQQQRLFDPFRLEQQALQHVHPSLLFGLEDHAYDVPNSAPGGLHLGNQIEQQQQRYAEAWAATLTAQKHAFSTLMAASHPNPAHALMLDQSYHNGPLSPLGPAGPAMFTPAQHRISIGSAPSAGGVHDMLLHTEHASLFATNPAAAAGVSAGGAGLGSNAAAATAAQLAESVLIEAEDTSRAVSQQLQFGTYSSSYGSSNGGWRTSPAGPGNAGSVPHQQQPRRSSDTNSAARMSNTGGAASATVATSQPAGPEGTPRPAAANSAGAEKAAGGSAVKSQFSTPPRLTGWASIAAKEPKVSPATSQTTAASAHSNAVNSNAQHGCASAGAWSNGRPHLLASTGVVGTKASAEAGKPLSRLPLRVRNEVQALIAQFTGVLKADDFDEGIVHQLNSKRSEEEAVAAVRHIAHYDLANIQHMAAYLNHLVKHYNHAAAAAADNTMGNGTAGLAGGSAVGANGSTALRGGACVVASNGPNNTVQLLAGQSSGLGSTVGVSRTGSGGVSSGAAAGGNLGAFGGQIRLASVPVSTKSMLQKLPLKVFKQLEQLVAGSPYLEWRHFDAGVVKVLAQLSKLCEADVFEELDLLAATDLSNVEYMPAYLNKRLNNKLWSRRKAEGHVPSN